MIFKIAKDKYYLFILVLYILTSFYFLNTNTNIVVADSRENLNIAYNLYENKTYSYSVYENNNIKTNFREPLYPYLISIFIKFIPLEIKSFDDILINSNKLKIINIFFLIILSLSFLYISKDLKLKKSIEILLICFILFGIYFSSINSFLTEVLAAKLLLLHSYFFYKYHINKKFFFILLSFICLILLVFTKSVFFYWLFIFIIINLVFFLKYKIALKNLLILILISSIPFSWQLRNYKSLDSFEFSSKERSILALSARVNLSNLTYDEYLYSYLYYNPFFKKMFDNNNFPNLDDLNVNGYYLTSHFYPFLKLEDQKLNILNIEEINHVIYEYKHKLNNKHLHFIDTNVLNDKLVEILILDYFQNIHKNLLLIPSTIFRMSNLNSGNSIYYISDNIFTKTYASIVIFISQLIFLFSIFLCLFKFRDSINNKTIFFITPSFFYLFFYSLFSMGIPRFGLVIFPSLLIFILLMNKKKYAISK